jgi:hypothetical protein
MMQNYPQVIAHDLTQLGRTSVIKHKINTSDAEPIRQYPYTLSPKHSQFLKEEIDRMKQQGLIVPSHSPWISPALVVGKANGKFRLVIDY